MTALPLLAAAAAAALLLGGKKKTPQSGEVQVEVEPTGILVSEAAPVYASWDGVRKDERGDAPWRIKQEADGFHALILDPGTQFGIVEEDVGVATSESGARILLRDRFNELMHESHPDGTWSNDPVEVSSDGRGPIT